LICSLIFKLHEFKVTPSPKCGAKFADFHPSKYRDTDRAPSDLHYKITSHSDILAKVAQDSVLWPQRLEYVKNK